VIKKPIVCNVAKKMQCKNCVLDLKNAICIDS
jgi:hypothetical protein